MTELTGEDITVTIDSVDYSVYFDGFQESGGMPTYLNKKAWNNTYYKQLTGYDDWQVTLNFRVNSEFGSVIYGILNAPDTARTIAIGSESIYKVTYTNLVVTNQDISFDITKNILDGSITFSAPGLRSNRVQS